MKWTGRAIGLSITLLLIVIGLLWPLVFTGSSQSAPPSDPVVITDYHAEFVVDADGRLDATEIITGDFPSGRHGIFRYWDVANLNSAHVRQEPRVTEILLDDRPVPYKMQWESGKRFRVAKIGDPNNYLDYGTHVFRIRYTIDGVLDPGGTGADKKFASSTGDPSAPLGVLLERRRPGVEQQHRTRGHLDHPARRRHRRPVFGRLRRGALPATT